MDNGPWTEWWKAALPISYHFLKSALIVSYLQKKEKPLGTTTAKKSRNRKVVCGPVQQQKLTLAVDGALTLFGFSQFDIPNLRVEMDDKKELGICVLQATPTNQEVR